MTIYLRIQYMVKMTSNISEKMIKQFNELSLELLDNNLEKKWSKPLSHIQSHSLPIWIKL